MTTTARRSLLLVLAASLSSSTASAQPASTSTLPTSAASTSAAPSAAPSDCRVVVLNLVGRNLPAADTDMPVLLTESLAAEVASVSGCQVVSQSDVAQMLDFEAQKAACGDGADSCLSEIGEALGADRVVGGTLGRLGGDFVVNARLMNVKQGTVEARAEQAVHGAVEELRGAAKNAARQLFGAAAVPPSSTVTAKASSAGHPGLFWGGVIAGGVGALGAIGGGALAGVAEARLSDADENEKSGLAAEGRTALAVAVVGGVVAVVGGGLVVAALVME